MTKAPVLVRVMLGAACAMLAVGPAAVDAAPKKPTAVKKKKRRSSIAEREAAAAAAAKATGPSKKVKLTSAIDNKMSDFSKRAHGKRSQVIRKIRDALPKMKGPEKADLIFQLAELFWSTSQFFYRREFAAHDKAEQAWYEAGAKPKSRPKFKPSKSEAFKKQALKNYAILLKKYPRYPRRDQVLFVMGVNLYEAGKKTQGVRRYIELVKKFPKSEFVADAYNALGEHYFNANNVRNARRAWTKALQTKKERVITYATYKLAWCDLNQGQYADAVERFQRVIRRAEESAKKGGKSDAMELSDEAAADIVRAFAHLDEVDGVYTYLKKVRNEKWAKKSMATLGAIYTAHGKYDLAVRTYRFMLKKYPHHLDAPMYQSNIVKSFAKLNKRDKVRSEANRLVDMYKPSSLWSKKVARMGSEEANDAIDRAYEYTEGYMRQLVTDFHSEAQKTKRAGTYRLARDIYKKYLDNFSEPAVCEKYETCPQAYKLRFFYAEILYDLKELRKAAVEYDRVVDDNPKGAYSKQAAFAAILCWEFIVKGVKPISLPDRARINQKKGRKKGKIAKTDKTKVKKIVKTRGKAFYTPKPIPADEASLAKACDRYVDKAYATSKDAKMQKTLIEVKFKTASIYHKYFHFEEAAKRYDELIQRWPNNKYAAFGAEAVLDSFAVREQYDLLNKYGRKFQTNKFLMTRKKFKTAADKYVEGATFQLIMAANAKAVASDKRATAKKNLDGQAIATGLFAEVAERFLAFRTEFPKSQFTPVSLVNAMMIFDRANKIDRAIEVGHVLLKDYEVDSVWKQVRKLSKADRKQTEENYLTYEEKARWALPSLYVRIADFKNAAVWFKKYYDDYEGGGFSGDGNVTDALYNALIFNRALGNTAQVVKLREAFVKKYKNNKKRAKDIANVTWQLALSYKAGGDTAKAAKIFFAYPGSYGSLVDENRNFDALFFTSQIWEDEKRTKGDIQLIRKKILTRFKKLKKGGPMRGHPSVKRAVGYVQFRALDATFGKYNTLKIKARKQSQMADQLKAKKKALEDVVTAYGRVILIGDPKTAVASLTRIGLTYADFADAIRKSPDPKGLTFDQIGIYRTGLESQLIDPNENEAIKWLEKARKKSFEVGVYNAATLAAQEALKRYKANEFPEIVALPFHASESFAVGD